LDGPDPRTQFMHRPLPYRPPLLDLAGRARSPIWHHASRPEALPQCMLGMLVLLVHDKEAIVRSLGEPSPPLLPVPFGLHPQDRADLPQLGDLPSRIQPLHDLVNLVR